MYQYDDKGYRVRKQSYENGSLVKTIYYVRDASGSLMSTYEQEASQTVASQTEVPIYGGSRLGLYQAVDQRTEYYLTDHLGNTRAIINRERLADGNVDVNYFADYYAYGSLMRSAGSKPRFGYQGSFAEDETEETGYVAFELRQYDAVIGRWLSTDPYGQYASPYVGMGNNPANGVDPDGGKFFSTEIGADGNVVDVQNDGDLNIYRVDANGNRTGEIIGQTSRWDEFMFHDEMGIPTVPMIGAIIHEGVTIDNYILALNNIVENKVDELGSIDDGWWLAANSTKGQQFDVKQKLGATDGYLLNGLYVTGRSAGNYQAGFNGYSVKPWYTSAETFWRVLITKSGQLHMRDNNLKIMPHNGRWSGEVDYAGEMIWRGYQAKRYGTHGQIRNR